MVEGRKGAQGRRGENDLAIGRKWFELRSEIGSIVVFKNAFWIDRYTLLFF